MPKYAVITRVNEMARTQAAGRQRFKEGTETSVAQVKSLLRRFDLRPKKRLGQHFLVDDEVLKQIILAAELTPSDTVIEVGPGLGILTRELAKRARKVLAIELDSQLASLEPEP